MTSAALDPGHLQVQLVWRAGRACAVQIKLARPPAARLLQGATPEQAARLAPLLFSVCGKAQGVAARLALAAAQGEGFAAAIDEDVRREARREHLWRLLLDWPQMLGMEKQEALFVQCVRALNQGGNLPGLDAHFAGLIQALEKLPDLALPKHPFLPALTAQESLSVLPEKLTLYTPSCTGALARQLSLQSLPPALAHVQARIHEWREPGLLGRVSAVMVAPGQGRALVDTARGLLLHQATLAAGRVANYQIIAPTDWNFAPRGPLHAWLAGFEGADADALRGMAGRAILALDPCVPWALDCVAA